MCRLPVVSFPVLVGRDVGDWPLWRMVFSKNWEGGWGGGGRGL